ncbi:hypothetical protein D3C85_1205550 [compost metagenome]
MDTFSLNADGNQLTPTGGAVPRHVRKRIGSRSNTIGFLPHCSGFQGTQRVLVRALLQLLARDPTHHGAEKHSQNGPAHRRSSSPAFTTDA